MRASLLKCVTYCEDLVSKANTGHGSWGSLGHKHHKYTLALGKEADATLSLLILTDSHLTHTCNIVSTTVRLASYKPQTTICI